MLRDVSMEVASENVPASVLANIYSVLEHDPVEVVSRCNRLVLHGFNNYLQLYLNRGYAVSWMATIIVCSWGTWFKAGEGGPLNCGSDGS